jgi:hypothetical protein
MYFKMEEEFRNIEGFDDYMVSNFGNVKNDKKNKKLKQHDSHGYRRVCLNGKKYSVHRLVALAFIENPLNKLFIDHVNNDRSDNRVENLRYVTNQENSFNSSLSKRNTSGSKGISWDKTNRKWQVHIQIDNITIYLGRYVNIEDAIEARRKKATECYGEYINKCELE